MNELQPNNLGPNVTASDFSFSAKRTFVFTNQVQKIAIRLLSRVVSQLPPTAFLCNVIKLLLHLDKSSNLGLLLCSPSQHSQLGHLDATIGFGAGRAGHYKIICPISSFFSFVFLEKKVPISTERIKLREPFSLLALLQLFLFRFIINIKVFFLIKYPNEIQHFIWFLSFPRCFISILASNSHVLTWF